MPIRTRDEMRRAIQQSVPRTSDRRQLSEREIYMARMRARMGGAATAAAVSPVAASTAAITAPRPAAPVPGSMGAYSVPGVGTFDRATGALTQPAVRGPAPAAPGFGAPAPVVSPASRARAEAANQALQNAGGANISERILPSEDAIKAAGAYAEARSQNPFAEIPALVDQRSQEYAQRADIAEWLKNMQSGSPSQQAIAQRFLAKQRPATPIVSQRSEAPDYSEGGAPTAPWTAADAPGPAPERGTVIGEKYYGKQWDGSQWIDEAQAPFAGGPLGTAASFQGAAAGIEFVPQATSQAKNLNFNSPLPEAIANQDSNDWSRSLPEDLLQKYKQGIKDLAFNAG